MSTTKYVTTDSTGNVNLLARAVDPNGNPITQKISITVNPLPTVPKCYNAILALSPVQEDINSACAQFGVANTYYLGNPRNTVYSDDSCSQLARDGFYKTEDGNWINVNGGAIRQRGSCSTVGRRESTRDVAPRPTREAFVEAGSRGLVSATIGSPGPQRFNTGGVTNVGLPAETRTFTSQPIPVRIPGQVREVLVQEPTFTAPSPTVTPPDPAFVQERAAFKTKQRIAQVQSVEQNQPILTSTSETL